jgi:hypothetical protein
MKDDMQSRGCLADLESPIQKSCGNPASIPDMLARWSDLYQPSVPIFAIVKMGSWIDACRTFRPFGFSLFSLLCFDT